MAMIFPGMDPYLENPRLWSGVHSALIVYLRDQLTPRLRPRYIAAVEERVYVEHPHREIIPDVWIKRERARSRGHALAVMDADAPVLVQVPELEVHETYIAILDRETGENVVTVIEVVSPSNKVAGPGRRSYLAKQREVIQSEAHLIEIDLLRTGPHALAIPEDSAKQQGPYDYLICVNRAEQARDVFELYPRRLRDRLPKVRVPLAGNDPDVAMDVQAVLVQTYEAGSYRDRLRYDAPCNPPLSLEDQAWADRLIREATGVVG
ncbi:MAG: DUF4058 family protein [Isosphaeraceae bacterium]